mgnify:CR=1 FL=1
MNFFDYKPVKLKISKWDFDEWRIGKIQKPSQEIKQMQEKKKSVIDRLTTDEKEIMNQVLELLQGKDYILESEVIEGIYGFSKAKIKRVIGKDYVLKQVGLTRVRVNKEIKEKYGIISKGYPFIICKEN